MKLRNIFVLTIFFMTGSALYAQVKISAELRPRTEYNHGVKTPALEEQEASIITDQRTRLNFDFKNRSFAFGAVVQDVRMWGEENQLTTNGNNVLYFHQAWAEWFISNQFSLKTGRQELAYDDHRILGNSDWMQQARSHDLALIKYSGKFNVHLGIAYNNQDLNSRIYTGPDAYKYMQFLWVNYTGGNYSAGVLFLNNGKPYWKDGLKTVQDVRTDQTAGTHIETKLSNVKLAGNLYYQFGEDVTGKDISAYNISLDAAMDLSKNINIGAGYELLSGTDQSESEKNNSFVPLYGTNHQFNGFMDYFYAGDPHGNVGLHDMYLKANVKNRKLEFNAAFHSFSADGEIIDQSKYLGTELDLWCGYLHKGQVQLNFGYSYMLATDALYAIKNTLTNDSSNSRVWLQLTFKPTLFVSKKD